MIEFSLGAAFAVFVLFAADGWSSRRRRREAEQEMLRVAKAMMKPPTSTCSQTTGKHVVIEPEDIH